MAIKDFIKDKDKEKEKEKDSKDIKLKVVEALQDDAYKGVARIDPNLMKLMDLKRGDIISIKGERETVAIVDRAYPADVGEKIIRIDGLIRRNAKTGVGEMVVIKKAPVKLAQKVTIAPAQQGITVHADPEMFKNGLLGRAITKGDIISLGGVQRRRDLMNDEFSDIFSEINGMFGQGFGFAGFQQIKFMVVSTNPAQACIINEDTEITLSPKAVDVSEEAVPDITYEDIGGLTEEVRKIREMVELPLKHPEVFDRLGIEPPKGVILHGPPGTGKTLLAKAVANESEANFILLNGPEIMSKFYGESEKKVRDIFQDAEKNAPSIIFIDEIDAIAPKREDVTGEVERRVVSQLLTMMDGLNNRGRVVVIGATNRINSIDPALRRPGRFDREVEISVPDKDGRLNILKIHTRNMPLFKDVDLKFLASKTHGFVGADLSALTKEAAMNVLRKLLPELKLEEEEAIPQEVLEKMVVRGEDFEMALKVVRPSAMREVLVETPNIGWAEIGGLEGVKQDLKEAVELPLKSPESFKRLGIRPPRGILLYGPPGTGKTLLAKAVAKESEANFISVKGPSLLSMWVGKSLPYNEELIVKDKGVVKRMKIGDIVENKLDVQVLSFDRDKRVRFAKIGDYIKHKLDSKLMEVTTRTGRRIKVTDYHSLFSFVNGKLTDVPTDHLIPDESYIAVPKNLNLPREEINEINLYEYFKKDESIFVSNVKDYIENSRKLLGLERVAGILGVSKKYLADIALKNLPLSIKNFDKMVSEAGLAVDLGKLKIKLKGSTHSYPVMFKINSEFWRLLGLWIAEGDFNSYCVRIHNQNPEIREDIRKICRNYNFKFSEMNTCMTINSLFLQKVFKEVMGLDGGSEKKRLPVFSFILDKESKANLLKGYFSGDGSIYPAERGKFKIEADTISKELANDLLYLLLDFGIVATCYKKESEAYNDVYRISILGVKNFERFDEIGFIDSARNKMISQYVRSRKWARSDLIPLSGELYELASQQSSVYSTNTSIGKEKLKSMLLYIDKDKTKYKEYWDLVEGDIYLDLVKEVKVIESEDYVYDISVPGEQNFVGGFGGIFAHNSEEGVRKIFERARQVSPCVVFFDEIDSLAGRRGIEHGNNVTERVLNQLLAEMDGLEDLKDVVVIGATNRPDMLDPALLRPGRFDRIILVDVPDSESRKKILEVHLKNTPLAADVKIADLITLTEGFVGADIEGLVREASMRALRKDLHADVVCKNDFDEALKKIRPSVSADTAKLYKKIEGYFLKSAKAGIEPSGPLYTG